MRRPQHRRCAGRRSLLLDAFSRRAEHRWCLANRITHLRAVISRDSFFAFRSGLWLIRLLKKWNLDAWPLTGCHFARLTVSLKRCEVTGERADFERDSLGVPAELSQFSHQS